MLLEDGDEVVLWMNTVGPYHNRQETYTYFSLPFCRGPKTDISHYHETLGEALLGVELDFSGLNIDFKGSSPPLPCLALALPSLTLSLSGSGCGEDGGVLCGPGRGEVPGLRLCRPEPLLVPQPSLSSRPWTGAVRLERLKVPDVHRRPPNLGHGGRGG